MRIATLATVSAFALAAASATAQVGTSVPNTLPANGANVDQTGTGTVDQAKTFDPSGQADQAQSELRGANDIVVTATRRASRLSDVPIAVSAVTPAQIQNSGITDIKQLAQVAPSLLVSSTSSEAGASGARIRGIGTVGDNPGLESSVATFVDGVYRNRPGVALSELGPVEQVEVLRGPQGTLFGRNASAGIINITTARPDLKKFGGFGDATYGNYNFYRFAAGVTGPVADGLAFRLDGVYNHRKGFLKDIVNDRRVNNRDRYFIKGKILYQPNDDFSVLLIGDYTRQNEECCGAVYTTVRNATRQSDGSLVISPSSIAALERSITSVVPGAGNGVILDGDPKDRRIALTPGQSLRSDVHDWGGSGQIDWKLGGFAKLTSITAYRQNKYVAGQDIDYNNLDLLHRQDDGGRYFRFKTFTQELRLQGSLFNDRLDWLLGGFYSNEKLAVGDNIHYGADFDQYAARLGGANLAASPALRAALGTAGANLLGSTFARTGFSNLNAFTNAVAGILIPAGTPGRAGALAAINGAVQNTPISGTGANDTFHQTDNNYAIFTHNIVHVTDKLSLTLGARHTWDNKSLDANLVSNSPCAAYNANIARLNAIGAAVPALAPATGAIGNSILSGLSALPCVINSVNGNFDGKRKEREWSGTAVLTYKATDRLLGYASYSRGYKAGGFNLDRAPFYSPATRTLNPTTNLDILQFNPEKVDAFEVGGKYRGRGFDINVAGFYQFFKSFQLNTFNGTTFFVTDIRGCKDDLGGRDRDQIAGNSACDKSKSGVTSKGFEVEAYLYPARDVTFSTGFTLADTKYANKLTGTANLAGNNSLPPSLSLLPGGRLSLSSLYSVTGSAQWTPRVGSNLRALFYTDFRYNSNINTGSDRFIEKRQPGLMLVNARIGIGSANQKWTLEGWVQNAFNVTYKQVAFNTTLQGSNTSSGQLATGQTTTQLFSSFIGDPRTFGLTVRTKF